MELGAGEWDYAFGRKLLREAIEDDGGFPGIYNRVLTEQDEERNLVFLGKYSLLLRAAIDPEQATVNEIAVASDEVDSETQTELAVISFEARGYGRDEALAIMVAGAIMRAAYPGTEIDLGSIER